MILHAAKLAETRAPNEIENRRSVAGTYERYRSRDCVRGKAAGAEERRRRRGGGGWGSAEREREREREREGKKRGIRREASNKKWRRATEHRRGTSEFLSFSGEEKPATSRSSLTLRAARKNTVRGLALSQRAGNVFIPLDTDSLGISR